MNKFVDKNGTPLETGDIVKLQIFDTFLPATTVIGRIISMDEKYTNRF